MSYAEIDFSSKDDVTLMGSLQTNICPPWPAYATQSMLSKLEINEYLDFAAALFSPYAHLIYLSFLDPTATRWEILETRDIYLRRKFPRLVPKAYDLRERESRGEADMIVNRDWATGDYYWL